MYERWLDGDDAVLSIAKNEDPFWEPSEDVLIGTANVFLQSLAYGLDFDDKLVVADYKGHEEGYVYVNVAPCSPKGKPLDEDYFVEDPTELLDKPYYFKVSEAAFEVITELLDEPYYFKVSEAAFEVITELLDEPYYFKVSETAFEVHND